ncbi:MAG: hypothetical protein IKE95_06075 [Methanobrevibacter sp.]|nr:hypothetical protein [Methanobrevibacter sp.]
MKKWYLVLIIALVAIMSMSAVSAGLFGFGDDSSSSSNGGGLFGLFGSDNSGSSSSSSSSSSSGSSYTPDDSADVHVLSDAKITSSNLKTRVYESSGSKYADTTGTITIEITDNNNHFTDVAKTGLDKFVIDSSDDYFYIYDYEIDSTQVSGNKVTFTVNNTHELYLGDYSSGTHDFDITSADFYFTYHGDDYKFTAK